MYRNACLVGLVLFLLITCLSGPARAESPAPLNVYSGAGLKKALQPIIDEFQAQEGIQIAPNYGPSGGLYAQITKGQPCDIFFSADWQFIEKLQKDGLLIEGKKFLTDFVAVIVSESGKEKIKSFEDLTRKDVVLCVADNRAPVGRYTENGLKSLGLMDKIQANGTIKTRPTTVNQVAIMVQEDQVDAGFTFKSVAAMYGLESDLVMTTEQTGEIVFGIGLIKGGNEALARRFMDYAFRRIDSFTRFGWKPYE